VCCAFFVLAEWGIFALPGQPPLNCKNPWTVNR
jgi:hypothetical protein